MRFSTGTSFIRTVGWGHIPDEIFDKTAVRQEGGLEKIPAGNFRPVCRPSGLQGKKRSMFHGVFQKLIFRQYYI